MANVTHTEPCGCEHAQADAPDDTGYGQVWIIVEQCASHSDRTYAQAKVRAARLGGTVI